MRWQDRDAASSAGRRRSPRRPSRAPPELPDGMRLGAVPSLWTGRESEHSAALRFLLQTQRPSCARPTPSGSGSSSGDEVEVSAGEASVEPRAAAARGVQPGSVFLVAGTDEDNATALTNGVPRDVEVRRPDRPRRPPPRGRERARPDRQGDRDLRGDPRLVPLVLLLERKLMGRIQSRYGPNRVGPYGLMQPLADVLKLLSKEQLHPGHGGAVDDGHRPGDLDHLVGGHAGDHPVRAPGRLGRRLRPLRHRRADQRSSTSSPSARSRSTR